MEITAALAAEFAILSEALDEDHADLTEALHQFVASARRAVGSYLGLTLIALDATFPLALTAMEPFALPGDVLGSLAVPLAAESAVDGATHAGTRLVVILYTARPGSFAGLAADLSRLTGRRLGEFAVDAHLRLPAEQDSHRGVQGSSLVNQAIGVLIGLGHTPEQAEREIDTRAAAAGHTRPEAAAGILAGLRPDPANPDLDA